MTTAEAKPERTFGPDWETLTAEQVEARAAELERVAHFVRAVEAEMWTKGAPTAGVVLAREDAQA